MQSTKHNRKGPQDITRRIAKEHKKVIHNCCNKTHVRDRKRWNKNERTNERTT